MFENVGIDPIHQSRGLLVDLNAGSKEGVDECLGHLLVTLKRIPDEQSLISFVQLR